MTSQVRYNTKEQIFLTQFYIYMVDVHHTTYEEFNELMLISQPEFSKFINSFKQMINDLKLNCSLLIEKTYPEEYDSNFKINTYYLQQIGEDYYFEYEHLNEEQLIKYSMIIVYLMLRNHQYVTTSLLETIFPNFTRKTMFNLLNKLKEIIPGEIEKNEIFSYVIELD